MRLYASLFQTDVVRIPREELALQPFLFEVPFEAFPAFIILTVFAGNILYKNGGAIAAAEFIALKPEERTDRNDLLISLFGSVFAQIVDDDIGVCIDR